VLREEKNLPLLLDAFVKVRATDPRARLLIVGEGPMKPVLTERAEQLGLADACIFQEATAYPADWMRAIDIFVLCSRSESFSNSLLEAMACGCCPVGSRVGGTGELVTHGETGLLFESGLVEQLADALCRLVQDAPSLARLAAAATRFAHDHLTIDIAAGRLAGIYRQLLGQEAVSGDNNETVLAVSKC
jgi:glycosyltransferase involved in cell wall biosynthesis